ncbi:MAG: hypothetical protein ABJB11_10770 [Ferruginibacter sp.]
MSNTEKTTTPTPALTGPTHGPQGVDKAPGEEESSDTLQFEQLTQKGKKDDGDPTLESDQPIDQSELPGKTDEK